MLDAEIFWKATTVLISAAFATGIWLGDRQRPANRFLAFFLLLIAGNQFAETFRTLAATASARLTWFRIATAFAVLDPFVLFCFAGVFPEENRFYRPRWLAGAAAPLLVLLPGLFVLQVDVTASLGSHLVHRTWAAYTAVVYLVVFGHFLHRYGEDEDEGSRWMVAAMAVATLPVLERLGGMLTKDASLLLASGVKPDAVNLLHLVVLPLLGAGALCRAVCGSKPAQVRRWIGSWLFVGVVITVAAKLPVVVTGVEALVSIPDAVSQWVVAVAPHGIAPSWRWLVFGSVVSAAVAREAILGMALRARLRAARALVAGWLVALLAAAVFALGPAFSEPDVSTMVVVGLVGLLVVATEGFHRVVRATARRLYGVPASDESEERMEVFRRGVEEAMDEDRSLEDVPELDRLRRELDLDVQTACLIRRLASGVSGPLRSGDLVGGRYRVRSTIGTGGTGRALLAVDEVLQRRVVLKEIFHEDEADGSLGRREAQLTGSIQHPNVVTVHDVLDRPGCSIIVTEHVPAGSLADRLAGGPVPIEEALVVLDGVLSGLAAVHAEGIVHRDLKPSNVLLVDDGTPLIADFGVARQAATETLDESEAGFQGTPGWMAPEQRRGGPVTPRTDIYAVGAIGRVLLPGDAPEAYEAVVERALAKDPERRWPSAEAMRAPSTRPEATARPSGPRFQARREGGHGPCRARWPSST